MYSIQDRETKRYIDSGKNSPDKQTAITALTSLLEPELEPKFLNQPDWAKAKEYETMGFEFEHHTNPV